MSAVSSSVTPRSSARPTTLRDDSTSSTPKLLQPRPTTETSMPELPSLRVFIVGSLWSGTSAIRCEQSSKINPPLEGGSKFASVARQISGRGMTQAPNPPRKMLRIFRPSLKGRVVKRQGAPVARRPPISNRCRFLEARADRDADVARLAVEHARPQARRGARQILARDLVAAEQVAAVQRHVPSIVRRVEREQRVHHAVGLNLVRR